MTPKPKRRNSKLGLTATQKAFKGSLKQAHLDRLTTELKNQAINQALQSFFMNFSQGMTRSGKQLNSFLERGIKLSGPA